MSTAANLSQRQKHQYAQPAVQQNMMHENLHQIIAQVNVLSFNASNAGCGQGRFGGCGHTAGDVSAHEDMDMAPQVTQRETFLHPASAVVFPMDYHMVDPPTPRIRPIHLEAILTEALSCIAPRKL